jgi:hypothetical protein
VQQQNYNREKKLEKTEIYILILHLSLVGFSFLEANNNNNNNKKPDESDKEEISKQKQIIHKYIDSAILV